ncbi:MAG: glycosyltransferase family 4 protein [Patescibacteria group bacterium]|jgi:glycosyltransferase involved in cell wall biosynthesis
MADAKQKKLLMVTQAVDPQDSALGFFCEWITEFVVDPRVGTIEVWCLREGEWKEKPQNVTIKLLPKSGRAFAFLSRVMSSRFDAVFVHMSPIWVALGGWWWRLTGQRVVLWYTHGSSSTALKIAMVFANQILTATKEAFPIPSKKVSAIGHGVGAAFTNVNRGARTSHLTFLGSGRITPRKRVIETLNLFSEIVKLRPDAKLIWVGEAVTESDKKYLEEVKGEIKKLNLEDHITLKGKIAFADLPKEYAKADLLLHLSATGSLDKVVIEALAAGCPVLSTNPATKEAIPSAFWEGGLDEEAVKEAVKRAEQGIAPEMRRQIGFQFSLRGLAKRILDASF